MTSPVSTRSAHVFLGVGLIATGLYFVAPATIQTFGYDLFGIACVAAIVVGVRRQRPPHAIAWWLFAAGLSLFVAGDVVLSFYDLAGEQPFPSLADALYLGGYGLLAAGLVVLIRGRTSGPDRAAMIDSLIIAIGIGVLAWQFWMHTYVDDPALSLDAVLISVAYPLMDIVLLGSVARLAIGGGERPAAFNLLGLSLVALLAADVGYGLTSLAGSYSLGSPVDAGYALSYVLWGAAALHPSLATMTAPAPAPTRTENLPLGRLATLAAASLAGPIAMGLASLRGEHIHVGVAVAASSVSFLLVLARLYGLMRLLTETALTRALATRRERTLRRAAAWLVGASDRDTVLDACCNAVAAVVGGSAHNRVTVWCGTGDGATVAASAGNGVSARIGAAIELGALPAKSRADLVEGTVVTIAPVDPALARALASEGDARTAFIAPLIVRGALSGGFHVLSDEPLDEDVENSLRTLRDQVALALESVELATEVHRRRGEERFAALVEQSSDVITLLDEQGRIGYQTPSIERVFGYAPSELSGRCLSEIVHPDDREQVQTLLSAAPSRPGVSAPLEWRLRHGNGSWRQTENVINNLIDDPAVGALVIDTRDITERKRLEAELAHQAFHDALTSLANRALFHDRAEHAVSRAPREGERHAVLFLDLDDFKNVNDSLGHEIGDQLLVQVAERVSGSCRRGDTASRLGGDEFAVLLESIDNPAEASAAAKRIALELRKPFDISGARVLISASIGIAVATGDEEGVGEVLRNADIAMYMAKRQGKARCVMFEAGMHSDVVRRLELESDLRHAVDRDEFFLQYQPIVELEGGTIMGVEALVRWRHPGRGVVPPLEFIRAAEDTGLIVAIGRWVLREACRQTRVWQRQRPDEPPLTINVNLSGRQLHDPHLVEDVAAVLAETGLAPECLTLEITETVMMTDTEHNAERLRELTALGVRLAIDDFGTGYSSLSYLRRFPVDVLKIAKPFVDDLGTDPAVAALAQGIVELGRTLHLHVVAEGIETAAQAEHLRDMHCELGQGFRYARPMDPDALEQLLADGGGLEPELPTDTTPHQYSPHQYSTKE